MYFFHSEASLESSHCLIICDSVSNGRTLKRWSCAGSSQGIWDYMKALPDLYGSGLWHDWRDTWHFQLWVIWPAEVTIWHAVNSHEDTDGKECPHFMPLFRWRMLVYIGFLSYSFSSIPLVLSCHQDQTSAWSTLMCWLCQCLTHWNSRLDHKCGSNSVEEETQETDRKVYYLLLMQ